MPPEGLKALFAVFLDALQEVQPAREMPERPAAPQHGTAADASTRVASPATPPMVNVALVVGANEITMQQEDRGVIQGSMWSADTNSEGFQEDQEDLDNPFD